MKYEDIKKGEKIRHIETGKVYTVINIDKNKPILDGEFLGKNYISEREKEHELFELVKKQYEVIFHMKSGNLINLGKISDDQKQWLLINAWKNNHMIGLDGFYFNFGNVDMMEFKETEQ